MAAAEQYGSFADLEVVPEPDAPMLAQLLAYWDGKRAARFACRRADIDPTQLGPHLPHIFMVDVLNAGADFRYRLLGTAIVSGLGRDSTGKLFSELYGSQPDALVKLKAVFNKVVFEKKPLFARGRVFWLPTRDHLRFAVTLLPLSDDGATVNIILAEIFIFWS